MTYKQQSKEELISNIHRFIKENGHEPTASDFDKTSYLPTARQIQRRWGGLQHIRTEMGLTTTNHAVGTPRKRSAAKAVAVSKEVEAKYHNLLVAKYHDIDNDIVVSRQYSYQQWLPDQETYANISCDTCIEDRPNKHRTLIDFFSASDERSVYGSVRIKANKLKKHPPSFIDLDTTYDIYFVVVNEHLNSNKFPTLPEELHIKVIDINQFNTLFLDTPFTNPHKPCTTL